MSNNPLFDGSDEEAGFDVRDRPQKEEGDSRRGSLTERIFDDDEDLQEMGMADEDSDTELESYWRVTVFQSVERRAPLLLILLVLQSLSSYILEAFSDSIIKRHPSIVVFLTMIVGTGGNAGGQSAAAVLQGMASGDIQLHQASKLLFKEFLVSSLLAIIVGYIGYFRCRVQSQTPLDSFVIAITLFCIVITSILVGTLLPLGFESLRRWLKRRFGEKYSSFVDPANTTFPAFQVIMDIIGMVITVTIAYSCYYLIFDVEDDYTENNTTCVMMKNMEVCDCSMVYMPLF